MTPKKISRVCHPHLASDDERFDNIIDQVNDSDIEYQQDNTFAGEPVRKKQTTTGNQTSAVPMSGMNEAKAIQE